MDVIKILAELRQEKQQLGETIASLERLALGGAKRRGRPPAWMTQIKEETTKEERVKKRGPGRPPGSRNKRAPSTAASAGIGSGSASEKTAKGEMSTEILQTS